VGLITDGTTSAQLLLVTRATTTRELRHVWHEPIDDAAAAVEAIRPAGPRTGQLQLLLPDQAAGAAAVQLLTGAAVLTLSCPERPALHGLTFRPTRELQIDEQATGRVVVDVGFREVTP